MLDERFPTAIGLGQPSPSDAQRTEYVYEWASVAPGGPARLVSRGVIDRGVVTGAGQAPRAAVSWELYDGATGLTQWSAAGLLTNPARLEPQATDELRWTRMDYDQYGRTTRIEEDCTPLLAAWRHNSWPAPMQRVTTMSYPPGRSQTPRVTRHPDGTATINLQRASASDPGATEHLTLTGVVSGSNGLSAPEAGTRTIVRDGLTRRTETVFATGLSSLESWPLSIQVRTARIPEYDLLGRPSGVDESTPNAQSSLRVEAAYDSFGNIARVRSITGEITRTQRTLRGMVERVYRGTNDQHEVWGTTQPEEDPCAATYSDNLAIIEKYTYGDGESDADQVVELRRYDQKVANQYRLEGCASLPENDEDQIGHFERYGYDWRMRRVWVEVWPSNQASAPTRIVATWFDNLDRVRFTTVFDPAIKAPPSTWPGDPRMAPATAGVPEASQLIGLGALSLTETVYDSRGNVAEQRHYDCGDGAGTQDFTAVRMWFDDLGREREREDPGVGTRRTEFDAAGREVRRSLLVNGAEVSVDSVRFDAADHPIETLSMLRRHDGVGSVLGAENAVILQRLEWFDSSGRPLAAASLGTNHAGNLFANGPQITRPEAPTYLNGVVYRPAGLANAMVEVWGYDQFGREVLRVDVSGAATRTAFDEQDRKSVVCENADGSVGRRTTAYRYDEAGRVSHVGARVADVPFSVAFPWDAADGSVQVTAIDYDGPLVSASTGALIEGALSAPDFVSRVRYPNPSTGQPDSQRSVSFGYRLDTRQVAMRVDPGSQLRYGYDERGNLIRIDANGGSIPGAPAAPITSVSIVINTFDALDRLVGCSTWGVQEGSVRALNQNTFAYDGRGNLVGEQAIRSGPHGLGVSDWTRYEWDVSGGGSGGGRGGRIAIV
jgi:YD repeat-containing protein